MRLGMPGPPGCPAADSPAERRRPRADADRRGSRLIGPLAGLAQRGERRLGVLGQLGLAVPADRAGELGDLPDAGTVLVRDGLRLARLPLGRVDQHQGLQPLLQQPAVPARLPVTGGAAGRSLRTSARTPPKCPARSADDRVGDDPRAVLALFDVAPGSRPVGEALRRQARLLPAPRRRRLAAAKTAACTSAIRSAGSSRTTRATRRIRSAACGDSASPASGTTAMLSAYCAICPPTDTESGQIAALKYLLSLLT